MDTRGIAEEALRLSQDPAIVNEKIAVRGISLIQLEA